MAEKTRLNSLASKLVQWRMGVQSIFLLIWLDPFGWRMHTICSPVFHCYSCPLAAFACPIGVIANFSALHIFPFIALGTLVVAGTLFGTLVCGWACPFGLLQDLVARIPTPKFDLPQWTGHFRYVVLVVAVLAVPYLFGQDHPLFICRLCPAGALEGAVPNVVKLAVTGNPIVWPSAVKTVILLLFLAAMFVKRRPWCRLCCPLGAFFGLFNRVSVFFLRFDAGKCTDCERCHKFCEYGGQPEKSRDHSACIRCLECTNCGPGAISLTTVFERKPQNKNDTHL